MNKFINLISGKGNIGHGKIFLRDVIRGLTGSQKRLSSKYFYDSNGSKIFEKITI